MNSTNSTNSTTTATSTNTSTQQVVTALVSNGTIFGVFVIAFLILRIKLKRIYEPKSSFNLINEEKARTATAGRMAMAEAVIEKIRQFCHSTSRSGWIFLFEVSFHHCNLLCCFHELYIPYFVVD